VIVAAVEPVLIGLGVALVLALVWALANFNRLIGLRNHVRESWSNVDVELKRRYELIPNLVGVVRGYARHEQATLEKVIELRNRAVRSTGPAAEQAVDENALQHGVQRVFALAEGYPELKADEQFLSLQRELAITEDRIAAGRRFYNGNVRDLRQMCEAFPTSLLASLFKIAPPTFFELDADAERVVPRV
jgi:LemA protein